MHFKLILALFTFVLVMNPMLLRAAEGSAPPVSNPLATEGKFQDSYAEPNLFDNILNEVDYQQQSLSEKIIGFTEEIDRYFINDDVESRANYSHLQLGYRYTRYKGGTYQLDPVFNAHIHLPRTQNRLTLEVSNNNPFASVNDAASGTSTKSSNPADPSDIDHALNLSLGYMREVAEVLNTKLTGGARFAGDKIRLFINLQLYREFFFKKWSLNLSEDFYRDNIVFSRATTQILLERKISEAQLFRSISKNIYYKDLAYSQNHQTFYVLDQLSEHDAVIYQVGSMWERQHSSSSYERENYYAMIRYSRKVYKDWLFMEISPQLQYLKDTNFEATPLIALQFTSFLGNNK